MRKKVALMLAIMLSFIALCLCGCETNKACVESILKIDSDFAGSRTVRISYPLSSDVDSLKDLLISDNPAADVSGVSFEYIGVEEDGYYFELNLNFKSKDEYIRQVSKLVGREVAVCMSQPNTILTQGTRIVEDFDLSELISWIIRTTNSNQPTKNLEFVYKNNAVNVGNAVFTADTDSAINISEREGLAVNSITIDTTNTKNNIYDRTITFSIPNETYNKLQGSITEYFAANTAAKAQYCGWTSKGTSWEYQVIYKDLSIDELFEYTSMLLDTNNTSVFYGDKNNSSTPLSEGLTFEESFDTFSFIGADTEAIKVEYKYALPTQTTHGDGAVFANGNWNTQGSWEEGVYSLSLSSDLVNIRIPDGIQYSINGINFNLETLGDNNFVRTTEFLYSKTVGLDGLKYAAAFFKDKGANIVTDEDEENLICRVVCEGTSGEITNMLVKYFGSGNFMAYDENLPAFSLSAKTKVTDYVNLGYMLNSTNANRPMTYTVTSSGVENITSLSCEGNKTAYVNGDEKSLTVNISAGQATVDYSGNIPNVFRIIVYSIFGGFMLFATVLVIAMLNRRRNNKESAAETTAPTQTTTFSISELNSLGDIMNMKYREEINKDIEQKIEADRLENLKKELKAKEIAEMERKIYGDRSPINDDMEKTKETDEE